MRLSSPFDKGSRGLERFCHRPMIFTISIAITRSCNETYIFNGNYINARNTTMEKCQFAWM